MTIKRLGICWSYISFTDNNNNNNDESMDSDMRYRKGQQLGQVLSMRTSYLVVPSRHALRYPGVTG